MCYSKDWLSEDEQRQREAKAKEAEAKRATIIQAMLDEAEKRANAPHSKLRVPTPSK